MVQYRAVRYCSVQYGTVWYVTVRYGTVRHGTVRYGTVRYGTVQHLPNLEIYLPNLEMAMGASSCTALVASSTLGAIWVGCEGPHWPTQCSIVAENAFFQCVCGTFHIWKCSCQIWKWPWGFQVAQP